VDLCGRRERKPRARPVGRGSSASAVPALR